MTTTQLQASITGRRRRLTPWIAMGCLTCVWASTVLLTAQTNDARTVQPMISVDGRPRLEDADVVDLANGETRRGRIVNHGITLHTAYGSIPLESAWLAGIAINQQPGHLDRIKTVNRNRLSGFINEPIEFQTDSGATVQWNKHVIDRIVFHQRETEAGHGATRRFLVLENGDLLSGRLLDWKLQSRRGRGSDVERLDDIELVQFAKGTREVQALLRNGQEVVATLEEDSLRMELDLGPVVILPVSHIQTLHARTETLPLAVRREFDEIDPIASGASTEPPPPTPDGMVLIQPGRFRLGSDPAEKGRGPDEDPATEVLITHRFWMGRHEVTQAEYLEVMGVNPSGYQGRTNLPVERVTWNEAVAYCTKRTLLERKAGRLPPGFVYRLPTEAEWEYACRAGATTRFHYGDDLADTELSSYAWFIANSDSSTQPVGQLKPNAWGLYDMHGNVWEWCQDIWKDAYPGGMVTNYTSSSGGWLRVARGGSWLYDASFCRSANRDTYGPDNRCSDIGFRIALAPPL